VKIFLLVENQIKLINQLKDGLGWVSFNDYQMGQVGIKSDKHTTSELRNVVFDKLGIEAKRPKVINPEIQKTLYHEFRT